MTTKIDVSRFFKKAVKQLNKKYRSLQKEIDILLNHLENDERPGDKIPDVGYDVYKVRIKNRDAQVGKSGGFRVIYYVELADTITLLTIYAKSEQENIDAIEIRQMIEDILESKGEFDEGD